MSMGGSKGLAPIFGVYVGVQDEHTDAYIAEGDDIVVRSVRK